MALPLKMRPSAVFSSSLTAQYSRTSLGELCLLMMETKGLCQFPQSLPLPRYIGGTVQHQTLSPKVPSLFERIFTQSL